jgi:hypothetical protein
MTENPSGLVVKPANGLSASRVWQVTWRTLDTAPRWVVALVDRLRAHLNVQVELVATVNRLKERAAGSDALTWAFDAKLFGDTPELCEVRVARALTQGSKIEPTAVIQLCSTADEAASQGRACIQFTVAGQPACELQHAVLRAVREGRGDLLLEARFQSPALIGPVVWQWRAGVDELSVHRTIRVVLELLAEMVQQAVGCVQRGQNPAAQHPLPVAPPRPVAGSHAWRAMRHAVRRATMVDQWGMTIYRHVQADSWLPSSGGLDLLPPADRFWADPFLVEDGETLWVFFEELRFNEQKGFLSCLSINAQGQVSAPQVVLEEDWHLSYPQVFEHEGRWYLLPESSARKNLVLYSAERLPGPWRPVAELLTNCRVADATVWQEGSEWRMVASIGTASGPINDMLQTFRAPTLTGPWVPLSQAPVRVDAATARPAGPRFQHHGKWYRPVQDCRQRYGRATHLLAMEGDLASGLQERVVATLEPRQDSTLQCVHTYCRTQRHLAVDWLRWRFKHDTRRIGPERDITLNIPTIAGEKVSA